MANLYELYWFIHLFNLSTVCNIYVYLSHVLWFVSCGIFTEQLLTFAKGTSVVASSQLGYIYFHKECQLIYFVHFTKEGEKLKLKIRFPEPERLTNH